MGQLNSNLDFEFKIYSLPQKIYQRIDSCTLQNKNNGLDQIKQYPIILESQKQMVNFHKIFLFRRTSDFILNSQYFQMSDEIQACSSTREGILYLENDQIRLSNIKDIPFPDYLHLYYQSLRGFEQLFHQFGAFGPQQSHFCINSFSKLKIWCHKLLSQTYAEHKMNPNAQSEMLHQVLYILMRNICDTYQPKTMRLQHRLETCQTFKQAIDSFNDWCIQQNVIIPLNLECVKRNGLINIASNVKYNQKFKQSSFENANKTQYQSKQHYQFPQQRSNLEYSSVRIPHTKQQINKSKFLRQKKFVQPSIISPMKNLTSRVYVNQNNNQNSIKPIKIQQHTNQNTISINRFKQNSPVTSNNIIFQQQLYSNQSKSDRQYYMNNRTKAQSQYTKPTSTSRSKIVQNHHYIPPQNETRHLRSYSKQTNNFNKYNSLRQQQVKTKSALVSNTNTISQTYIEKPISHDIAKMRQNKIKVEEIFPILTERQNYKYSSEYPKINKQQPKYQNGNLFQLNRFRNRQTMQSFPMSNYQSRTYNSNLKSVQQRQSQVVERFQFFDDFKTQNWRGSLNINYKNNQMNNTLENTIVSEKIDAYETLKHSMDPQLFADLQQLKRKQ